MQLGEREYHLPGCMRLLETNNSTLNLSDANNSAISYSNLSFIRQTIRIAEGDYKYFYPQARIYGSNKVNITSCYHCIVSSSNVYPTDEIIKGEITDGGIHSDTPNVIATIRSGNTTYSPRLIEIRNHYLRALGRERYDLYRANVDAFNIN